MKTLENGQKNAVVLPDRNDSYSYYLEDHTCCFSFCRTHYTNKLFKILRENKFKKKINQKLNARMIQIKKIYSGECSYIKAVKWKDFINDIDKYIDESYERLDNIDDYNICKEI